MGVGCGRPFGRWLFSVFGQCGAARWFASGWRRFHFRSWGFSSDRISGGSAGGRQDLFEAAGGRQEQSQKVFLGR